MEQNYIEKNINPKSCLGENFNTPLSVRVVSKSNVIIEDLKTNLI